MSTTTANDSLAPPTGRRAVLVAFTGLLLVMLMASLDQTIVSTALPTIVGDLGGLGHISWVVTAYLLAQTAVTPIYGKLGDLYGRKVVLQVALVIFLAGSALCGIAQNLTELVVFRAIQGLGGGGLMVGAMAAVGDIVSPRERGRYQGIFGAVFGLASVIGPLLGGFLTSSLSWRWIFYVNLPIGVVAFGVLAATLPARKSVEHQRIDYTGATLLALALVGIVLVCTIGGVDYKWLSWRVIGLAVLSLALVVGFTFYEGRAAEPVLPPRLFKNRIFTVASAVGLIVGFALFGSVTYLPLFLQIVGGASPTGSGLQILPLMAGLLITSIGSGQIITRTGKYRVFPIFGTFVMVVGLFLLSRMDAGTSHLTSSLFMFVLGLGLGSVMQVLVLVVQNSVDYSDLGVATSGATLFRSIGGSIGTSILGSLFSSKLKSNLATNLAGNPQTAHLPPAQLAKLGQVSGNPESLKKLAPPVHAVYIHSFTDSIDRVFLVAAGVAAFAFLLSWLIEQRPLRESVTASTGMSESFAVPRPSDSLNEMARALSVLLGREGRRQFVENIAARAGVDLPAASAWLLVVLAQHPDADLEAVSARFEVPLERTSEALRELTERDLVVAVPLDSDDRQAPYALTERGQDTARRLSAEREATLTRLLEGWNPEQHAELTVFLTRLAGELGTHPTPELRQPVGPAAVGTGTAAGAGGPSAP